MSRKAVAGALALVLAAALPPSATAQDAGAILDRAVTAFTEVTTLRADFTQTVRDPMIGTDETTRGQFFQRRPDRFAMRWRDPAGDLILADGRYLWVYLPSTTPNQVIRSELTGRPGQTPDVIAEFLDRPRERFGIAFERAESIGGRPSDVLALTPRDRSVSYRRVLIWVDRRDALVRRVEITEASGAIRRVTLDGLRVNPNLPASTFVFRPPPGVRIIDATR